MQVQDAIARHRRTELMVAAAVLTEVASTTNGSPLADAVAEILDQLQQLLHHLADGHGAIT